MANSEITDEIEFDAIEVQQPIGKFYVGSIECKDLFAISVADIRRMVARDIENIVGIQRPINDDRVKELMKYVTTVDATFPTSVILAVSSEHATYKGGKMRLARKPEVASIIDGQHRIKAFDAYAGPPFFLNVTLFVDMDIEDQAYTFATINLKQTKVSRSLAYDLYEFASTRSPQKSCHMMARLMNSKDGSPLRGRIKILGSATDGDLQFLTQALFVDRTLQHICKDSIQAIQDRDVLKRRKKIDLKAEDEHKCIFRRMFVEGADAEITRVLWNFFNAVATRWPIAWNTSERGHVLNRSQGFAALMRALRPIIISLDKQNKVPSEKDFASLFQKSALKDSYFTTEHFKPGTSGETALFNVLIESMNVPKM